MARGRFRKIHSTARSATPRFHCSRPRPISGPGNGCRGNRVGRGLRYGISGSSRVAATDGNSDLRDGELRILCNSDLRLSDAAAVTKPTRQILFGLAKCLQVNAKLLAFLVEMAALEAER